MTLKLFFLSTALFLITACNGSSGENTNDPLPGEPVVALSLSILDSNCDPVSDNSFTVDERICVQASLTRDNSPFSNEVVAFSSGIGSLDVATKLTDAAGIAQVFITSDGSNIGAAQVVASYDSAQAIAGIEYVASQGNETPDAQIQLRMVGQNGEPTQRFKANQQVRLVATLQDVSGEPVANEIIQFSVTRGELSITDALTNAQGSAETQLSAAPDSVGAGIATITVAGDDTGQQTATLNYEIQSVDAVEEDTVRIGYFEGADFVEGVLGVSGLAADEDVVISAGATLGLSVGLADSEGNPIIGSTPISFTSSCVTDGKATIDQTVSTVNGRASSTYEDINCAGGSGNDDIITATVLVNSTPFSVSRSVELQPESIGSIEFISAEPASIVLQGTGGQGSESVSTITFQVNGALGNPLAQKPVSFSLNTTIGGLTLSPVEGLTNSQGQVSTRVTAGSVPTSVRVTATVEGENDQDISTQSDLLTVNTGLPDQNSFSLSTSNPNPEANSIDGNEVTVTAFLADSFNNPVPDGTAVAFTTEGGQIQPSCVTSSGSCSVTWTSADPRVDDHRITILATAIGHETLIDSNGNNVYDDADGGALSLGVDSGFNIATPTSTGFVDMSEAWRDDNENDIFDVNETFLDFNGSGNFTDANTLFDGPQCDAANCGASGIHVRRALIMIMSSSSAIMRYVSNGAELASTATGSPSAPVLSIPRGDSATIRLLFSDTAGQPMPSTSQVLITANNGDLAGEIDTPVRKSTRAGESVRQFVLTNDLIATDDPINSTVTATITSPSGVDTTLSIVVRLE
ncbi:Ig-like protein, group 1 [Alteromonas oceanisediminis]|uniref:Ig-like protein, group 1 n=1 Tax=Alteromonas oceanisediminis TaxID=2836180 RepID=UPI001BDADA05|nr:Ig-like protein, group 1 [Alteromonas oceanisediminis]MBT0586889.1 Ig-like protein, group 1 [Alteromonas oceanisediminis]